MSSNVKLDELLESARAVGKSTLLPNCRKIDEEAQWPEEGLRALQNAGLAGLLVPTDCDGHGQGLLAMVQVCEVLGQSCASTSMCFGMHCVASYVIAAKATEDHKERFLRPIARGEHLSTLALSEPGSGAHFYLPQTRLTSDQGGDFKIAGRKSFVTNGGHADSYVVSTVAAEPGAPAGKFSCILVEKDAPGLKWGHPWNGIGMRGNSSISLELADVQVPRNNLLGEQGDQIWYVFEAITPFFLMAMAGTYLGIAEAALQEAVTHLKNRRYSHSGATLADQPVLQHRVGTLWSEVEQARQLVYHAARLGDSADPSALPAILSSKAQVADTAVRTVNEAMTLMGGIAYAEGSKLSCHLRDVRAAHVMGPTTDILRTWTGRAILERPLLGD